jgi:hypothetical protein
MIEQAISLPLGVTELNARNGSLVRVIERFTDARMAYVRP